MKYVITCAIEYVIKCAIHYVFNCAINCTWGAAARASDQSGPPHSLSSLAVLVFLFNTVIPRSSH